jgi:hypothetical protein
MSTSQKERRPGGKNLFAPFYSPSVIGHQLGVCGNEVYAKMMLRFLIGVTIFCHVFDGQGSIPLETALDVQRHRRIACVVGPYEGNFSKPV